MPCLHLSIFCFSFLHVLCVRIPLEYKCVLLQRFFNYQTRRLSDTRLKSGGYGYEFLSTGMSMNFYSLPFLLTDG
jgi:hypothetical protein